MKRLATVLTLLWLIGDLTPAKAVTAYYQPTPYPSKTSSGSHVWDGWLNNSFNTSFVWDDKLQVGGWGDNYRTYLKLDLIGLPASVSNAVLWLYSYPRGDSSTLVGFDLWRPTSDWSTGLTWGSQPPVQLLASYNPGPASSWWGLNITNTFNNWKNGTFGNYGVRLDPWATNNNFNVFRSSRYSDRSLRPQLQLDFTPPIAIPDFKLPLPGNISWLVTTEIGGWDCLGNYDSAHDGSNYFSVDFSWRNQGSAGSQVYGNPANGYSVPVIAAAEGYVQYVNKTDPTHPNGYYVVINHNNDINGNTGFSTRYLHLNSPPSVSYGQHVYQGDLLGYMGNTGQSTGPHLHFGIRYNDNGSATQSQITYVTVSGLLLKSYQTECSAGSYTRYYYSNNRIY